MSPVHNHVVNRVMVIEQSLQAKTLYNIFFEISLLICFLKNGGGGGNRTRVRSNAQFKSLTGLDYFLKQSNGLLKSRCFTNINNSGVLLSAEPPAYSLLGNKVSEDPANYAARARD